MLIIWHANIDCLCIIPIINFCLETFLSIQIILKIVSRKQKRFSAKKIVKFLNLKKNSKYQSFNNGNSGNSTAEAAFLFHDRHHPVPRRSKESNVLKRP